MVTLGLVVAAYLQIVIMLAELKRDLGVKRKGLCSKTTKVLSERTIQKCILYLTYLLHHK